MNEDSIDELLRSHRPDDSQWPGTPAGYRAFTTAKNDNLATKVTFLHGKRSRRSLAVAGVLVVATGGGVAAAALFKADSPTQAGCYNELSPQADTTEASAGLVEQVGPVEACRQTWTKTGASVDTGNLVICINEHGGRGVFPALRQQSPQAACGSMGWQPEG